MSRNSIELLREFDEIQDKQNELIRLWQANLARIDEIRAQLDRNAAALVKINAMNGEKGSIVRSATHLIMI